MAAPGAILLRPNRHALRRALAREGQEDGIPFVRMFARIVRVSQASNRFPYLTLRREHLSARIAD